MMASSATTTHADPSHGLADFVDSEPEEAPAEVRARKRGWFEHSTQHKSATRFMAPSTVYHIGGDGMVRALQIKEVLKNGIENCQEAEPDTPALGFEHRDFVPSPLSLELMSDRMSSDSLLSDSTIHPTYFTHDAVVTPGSYTLLQQPQRNQNLSEPARRLLKKSLTSSSPLTQQDTQLVLQVLEQCKAQYLILNSYCQVIDASSTWVVGSINGEIEKFRKVLKKLLLFGEVRLTPHNILFLGNYGRSLEALLLLAAMKVVSPSTIHLLRGDEDDASVCLEDIHRQCVSLFGEEQARAVSECIFDLFAHLPISSVINGSTFCSYSSIPVTGDTCNSAPELRFRSIREPDIITLSDSGPAQLRLLRSVICPSGFSELPKLTTEWFTAFCNNNKIQKFLRSSSASPIDGAIDGITLVPSLDQSDSITLFLIQEDSFTSIVM
eukprot:TRINITY_DN3602_c0_g1_i1.p1 TRINITY_DN3602_c0_g1~~TRINITY_DN3602_c0_g1_i1.p1  ORF type:complete len:439 (+),score=62.30 TRINITY_DN3602_c0_g1_i1:51-1367(+)